MSGVFKYRKPDGMAIGTQGWEANHEKASCLTYTGLWRGKKVVALLVARGDYDQQKLDLHANGDFIVRACNAHDDLAAALLAILAEVTPGPVPSFSADSYLPAHLIEQARAALEKSGAV